MAVRIAAVVVALLASLLPAAASAQEESVDTACPRSIPDARFRDVKADHLHDDAVDCAVWWDIARGTSRRRYRPAHLITREQTATFVARLVLRSGGRLPATPRNWFDDDKASAHHYSINRLAGAGVVSGRGGRFRPQGGITRAQMATLLVNAYEHRTGAVLSPGRNAFRDDATSVHEDNINKAAAAGFTGGVSSRRFDPTAGVTRAQMATFVTRVLQAVADTGQVEQSPATLRSASALVADDRCNDLLGHLKERGTEHVTPWGWGYGYVDYDDAPDGDSEGGGDSGSGGSAPQPVPEAPADGSGGEARDHSGTNNQEEGVDESDIVKTDGRHIFAINNGRLRAIDVTGDTPFVADRIRVTTSYRAELLLSGSRLLVLATEYDDEDGGGDVVATKSSVSGWNEPMRTVLTVVDASNPRALRIEQQLEVDGETLTARMIDGVARVVVRAEPPALDFVHPDGDGTTTDEARQRNLRVVERSAMSDWLPRYRHTDHRSGEPVVTEDGLMGCHDLRRPPEFSGLGTINVLTVDVNGELTASHATGVLAGAETAYASAQNLYIATTHWGEWTREPVTDVRVTSEIHQFAIDDPAAAEYRASGKVVGTMLNQFSMSENDGNLRVATTSQPSWWGDGEGDESQSMVSVLTEDAGALRQIGFVDGLGRGEQIFAVRFLDDVGYVVTFRETDPLYTIDLADPTQPRVVGELKILGYSAYLHPVGDGRLLGVGQDADEDGRRRGAQLSLFDVSDPADPRRVDAAGLGEGSSTDVEFDHRAFLHWPATGTTVLPLSRYTYDEETDTSDEFVGAVGFDVDASALSKLGEVSHGNPRRSERWPGIRRSVVVGSTVYTLSDLGLKGSDLETFDKVSWVAFE